MKDLSQSLRFAMLIFAIGIDITGYAQTNFYFNSTGDPSQTSSWGTKVIGKGEVKQAGIVVVVK